MNSFLRTNEHKRAVKNQDVDKNEIADQCWKNDHEMNWEERKVIKCGAIYLC